MSMKFSIQRSRLKEAIQIVEETIGGAYMGNKEYSRILVETTAATVRFTSIVQRPHLHGVSVSVPCVVDEQGCALFPRDFVHVVNGMEPSLTEFTTIEHSGNFVKVSDLSYFAKFEAFPRVKHTGCPNPGKLAFTVRGSDLERAINQVKPAITGCVSKYNVYAYRFAMNEDGKSVSVVATDNRFMHVSTISCSTQQPIPFEFSVNADALGKAINFLHDAPVSVYVGNDQKFVHFCTENITIFSGWVDQSYPNWKKIFESNSKGSIFVKIRKADLLSALDYASRFSSDGDDGDRIKLETVETKTVISIEKDGDQFEYAVSSLVSGDGIDVEYRGQMFTHINWKFLLPAVQCCDSGFIRIYPNGNHVTVMGDQDPAFSATIMKMHPPEE